VQPVNKNASPSFFRAVALYSYKNNIPDFQSQQKNNFLGRGWEYLYIYLYKFIKKGEFYEKSAIVLSCLLHVAIVCAG
jgi:hypothetical protein